MNLKLVSSNIRFDSLTDGRNRWVYRREILAKMISKENPDIIATQEGRENQLRDLENLIKDYQLVDNHRHWISERMYPSIFINKSKIKMLDCGDIWLSETPNIPGSISFESRFPRLATWIKAKKNKQIFYYYNLHLDHILESTRMKQIEVLARQIDLLHSDDHPKIIGGDFNNPPHGAFYQLTRQLFPDIVDPWPQIHINEESSHHNFCDAIDNDRRIDWILVDKKFKIERICFDKDCIDDQYPSDHYPLRCDLSI